MSREIRAVLFDFGGVFTESPFAALDELSKELGVAPRELLDIVFGPYHEDTDHPWHRLERGEVSLADFAGNIDAARHLGLHGVLVDTDVERAILDLDEILGR